MKSDINQTNLAIAAIAVSFAKALDGQFPEFLKAFDKALEEQYRKLEDSEPDHLEAMETLKWVHELIQKS